MSTLPRFALVVPVKTLTLAKSRLTGFADDVRRDLASAFALDALAAALACPAVASVAVVTGEPDLALNRALSAAVRTQPAGPVAAMLGDLPCLVPGDLEQALASVQDNGFVADSGGTGTTLVAVHDATSFTPHFGVGSRAAHLAAGLTEVTLAVPTLRRDVDTAEDLAAAERLGLGPRTTGVLART
jgi:2-phospho-L-lactate guanylyltransferase